MVLMRMVFSSERCDANRVKRAVNGCARLASTGGAVKETL
jgi:hypothetical protein